ncbi:MAG: hypothetical protein EB078_07540 [Proteobacteria bacterium]|nr:hypothetical protein [Pseudomonadota bacterium]NDD04743.1 hypothetical protein [Pseudomonadota bacterium]
MIERYSRPEMSHLWSEESQYRTWLDIEVLACEGWAKLGKIPASDMKHIRERAGFDLKAVQELEKKTGRKVVTSENHLALTADTPKRKSPARKKLKLD